MGGQKAYIATAEALDDEMKERIEMHRKSRGVAWDTYEEPLKITTVLSDVTGRYRVVVLDCLTLWLSNMLMSYQDTKKGTQVVEDKIQELIDSLKGIQDTFTCSLFIVSNEVGMGIVPENKIAREFRDLTGLLNQKVAAIADEVYLVTVGLPLKIKTAK
jgi:adenosylcobinamide kinase/adenosylcobinamide-phosphate guanylyltransferase